VFKNFERNGEFFCFTGQTTQAVTGMFNLYRATQVMFPGEKILEHGKHFSAKFLRDKRAANELVDKWIIMKNLAEEVGSGLIDVINKSTLCGNIYVGPLDVYVCNCMYMWLLSFFFVFL